MRNKYLFVAVFIFTFSNAWSAMPVIDASQIAKWAEQLQRVKQQIKEAKKGNNILEDQARKMVKQIEVMEKQFNAMTGDRGYSDYINNTVYLDDVSKFIDINTDNGPAGNSVIEQEIKRYNELFTVNDEKSISPNNPDSRAAQFGHFASLHTNAAFGTASGTHDLTKQFADELKKLSVEAGSSTDLKASADAQSTILTKVAELQLQLLRIQTHHLHIQALQQQQDNEIQHWQAKFIADLK